MTMDQDPSAFEEEENRLEQRLSDDPDDAEAQRELGSIYIRTDRPSQAYDALKKAYSQRPDDPKVLFYLGLASEEVGRREAALDLFAKYGEVPEDSKYRTLMEGRYEWLNRKMAENQAEELVAQEQQQPSEIGDEVSSNTVAVVPIQYQGGDDQYEALGRGLAEMFTTDLSNVGRLKVVERVRLQAILDELKLAQSEYVDQSTAPRVGRLLGAGRLVGGSYLVADEEIRLQVTLADVTSGERTAQLEEERTSLDNLFELQTRVTFSIVDQLGVELTSQEQAAIEEVPTQSIQAFLAYSRGLLEEDRGNYGAAAQQYQRAQEMDPDFEQAEQRQQKARSVQAGGGNPSNALAAEQTRESGGQSEQQGASSQETTAADLVNDRLDNMGVGGSTGAGGETTTTEGGTGIERNPAQESSDGEEASELDAPPTPTNIDDGG